MANREPIHPQNRPVVSLQGCSGCNYMVEETGTGVPGVPMGGLASMIERIDVKPARPKSRRAGTTRRTYTKTTNEANWESLSKG